MGKSPPLLLALIVFNSCTLRRKLCKTLGNVLARAVEAIMGAGGCLGGSGSVKPSLGGKVVPLLGDMVNTILTRLSLRVGPITTIP